MKTKIFSLIACSALFIWGCSEGSHTEEPVIPKPIAVTGITLSNSSITLIEGDSQTLQATVAPSDATDKRVTWSSSNSSVATVSESGTVTAVKEGTAEVTATAGGKSAKCTVTVKKKEVAVTEVTLSQTSLALTEGETATLTATVAPDNATNKKVTWTTSNDAVATVSEGTVTAVKAGTAEITAAAGGKTAKCTVTVKQGVVAVTSVTLSQTTLALEEGKTATLTATVAPDNATDKSVTWTSSNSGVATVSATGKVTAVKEGTAEITATAGGKSAKCTVTVKKKVIAVTSVTLSQTSLALTEGETATLTATVTPENATDKSVTWSSSNSDVATVSESGTVTALKAGTAEITANAGEKTATCTVTVKAQSGVGADIENWGEGDEINGSVN